MRSYLVFTLSLGLAVLAVVDALGQTALSFEVASVRPSGPKSIQGSDGGPGSRDPERYTDGNAPLRSLIFTAYGLKFYDEQISGPGWIGTEKYDIAVKLPPGATKEQFRQMLQNLLAERFKLVVHGETKEFPVYELVVAKGGPKFKESAALPSSATVPGPGEFNRRTDGTAALPPGRPGLINSFVNKPTGMIARLEARQQPIERLAEMLYNPTNAGRPVLDKTGLTGKYDFTLEYDVMRGADNPGLSILDAVQEQLGLKLVPAKAPFDVIVVDHAEKVPSEN
jgi:uncharacterized protein (TIGR03435 family)